MTVALHEAATVPVTAIRRNTTLNIPVQTGDLLIWFPSHFADPARDLAVRDVWEIRSGDWVTVTNRSDDLPSWFEMSDGPNLWRVMAGDRIAWVGDPRGGFEASRGPTVLDFHDSALVAGEPTRPGLEAWSTFGSLSREALSARDTVRCGFASEFVIRMGTPRTSGASWSIDS